MGPSHPFLLNQHNQLRSWCWCSCFVREHVKPMKIKGLSTNFCHALHILPIIYVKKQSVSIHSSHAKNWQIQYIYTVFFSPTFCYPFTTWIFFLSRPSQIACVVRTVHITCMQMVLCIQKMCAWYWYLWVKITWICQSPLQTIMLSENNNHTASFPTQ